MERYNTVWLPRRLNVYAYNVKYVKSPYPSRPNEWTPQAANVTNTGQNEPHFFQSKSAVENRRSDEPFNKVRSAVASKINMIPAYVLTEYGHIFRGQFHRPA